MMTVAAHVLDGAPPPHALTLALNCQHWHVDVMQLPAGLLPQMNAALNVYNAVSAWKAAAGHTAEWTRSNRDAWRLVSAILRERMKANDGA